ncbi:hypothetical protein BS78_09G215600 [Paspalum vaginatum]|nr:hypothetical protein BS78_09G215600 [Paspalum vaginatum]
MAPPCSSTPPTASEPCSPTIQDRLTRIFVAASRVEAERTHNDGYREEAASMVNSEEGRGPQHQNQPARSSAPLPCPSVSPRWHQLDHTCSSSPSLRITHGGLSAEKGGDRSRKRKSPCATMPPFRSPLSRMIQLPRALLRSPVAIQNTSPSAAICRGQTTAHTIDLNVQPEGCVQESDENVQSQPQGYAENDENIQQEGYSQESHENLLPQENARKNLTMSDEKRRAIFESLPARANNGEVTGHEKKEVSEEF